MLARTGLAPIVKHPLAVNGAPLETLYGLDTGFKRGRKNLSITQTAITGTGAVTTGLNSIDTGGAMTTVQNAETTITSNAGSAVTSISAGTVNVLVIAFAAAANSVSAAAKNLAVWAVGNPS